MAEEMTLEQQQALAMASARLRLQQQQQTPSEIPAPRRSYSWSEVPSAAVKNLSSSGAELAYGIARAIAHPIDTAQSLLDVGAGALQNVVPKALKQFIDQFDANPEAAQRAVNAANAVGGAYVDRYGSVDAIKRTLAEDPVGAAADLSTLLNVGGAGAKTAGLAKTGAAMTKTGAAINPLRPVEFAARVVGSAASPVVNMYEASFNPKNALYLRAAEGRGPELVNALRSAQELVPGSVPTAAQAAADTGIVGFQKLGKSAAKADETAYRAREAEQAAAQLQAARNVGKTPADIEAAKTERAAETDPLYQQADRTISQVDSQLLALMDRPSMNNVMARAAKLAAEKDMPFQLGKNAPETRTPSVIVDEAGRPIGETVTPAQYAKLPGTSVHFIKQAFDDLIRDPATFGIGAAEARAISGTRAEFLKWVEQTKKNPAYKEARETFAKMSEPINQMEVAQFLERKLAPALGEDTARLRSVGYAGALEAAPATIKKATGETRFKTLEEMFKSDPESLKALHDIRDDLARQAKSEKLSQGGVPKDVDVSRATEALAGETALPNMLNRVTAVTNEVWRRLRGKIDKSVAAEVAAEMLFPGKAADALAAALQQQKRRDLVKRTMTAPIKAVYATPGFANMLAPAQESQNALAP